MPVHLYGHPANMPELINIARRHNLHIIEDAAPAIGSYINDQPVGSFGDISCFSFQGAKILSSGDGGIIATGNTEIFSRIKLLSDHGRDPNSPFAAVQVGYKYKMSNLQAAMALAQLERLEELVAKKRKIYSWYKNQLSGIESITLSSELQNCRCNHWMTSILILDTDKYCRDSVRKQLKDALIDTRPVFSPLSSLPMFSSDYSNPIAYRVGSSAINLPSGHNLTYEDISYICQQIAEIFA